MFSQGGILLILAAGFDSCECIAAATKPVTAMAGCRRPRLFAPVSTTSDYLQLDVHKVDVGTGMNSCSCLQPCNVWVGTVIWYH